MSHSGLQVKICESMSEIPAEQWNRLVEDNNPFVRHEFLHALEKHHCVGESFGWLPRHIAVYRDHKLVGAMPLYEKYNSYGEFVFDHAWAQAYQHHGFRYFPKLVSAVPYTPATGQRLLAEKSERQDVFPLLLQTVRQLSDAGDMSGFHCLFPKRDENRWMEQQGLLTRFDCQFHWHNDNYGGFDDFLAKLKASKRKNIRKERRKVEEAGVVIRQLSGHSAFDEDWRDFDRFYQMIYTQKWGVATLNYGFFKEVAQQLPDQVLLVLADVGGECVAGSLMYRSDQVLYGRFWGCAENIDYLHFEACYYQGIDYCINQGLKTFEPGAQGEHKVPRGFEPTLMRSSHFLTDDYFKPAIKNYVEHEQQQLLAYMEQMKQQLPFRNSE